MKCDKKRYLFRFDTFIHQFSAKNTWDNMKILALIFLVAIAQKSSAQVPSFILNVVYTVGDLTTFRCLATAFTMRHALTIASCVDVPLADDSRIVLNERSGHVNNTFSEIIRHCKLFLRIKNDTKLIIR